MVAEFGVVEQELGYPVAKAAKGGTAGTRMIPKGFFALGLGRSVRKRAHTIAVVSHDLIPDVACSAVPRERCTKNPRIWVCYGEH